jgi:hypothetical protein
MRQHLELADMAVQLRLGSSQCEFTANCRTGCAVNSQ